MALISSYVVNAGSLKQFFDAMQKGEAPSKLTINHLKDMGFQSSNWRAVLPLLKSLNFLSQDGVPTQRYHDYRDRTQAPKVLGRALREGYEDLFVLRADPKPDDKTLFEGKFKSTHNTTDHVARLMANTFFALLDFADISSGTLGADKGNKTPSEPQAPPADGTSSPDRGHRQPSKVTPPVGLHYNIQIHLPPTKEIEVFNAIFKSLKEHLLD